MWALYEVKVIILTIIGLPPEPEMGEFLFTYAMRKQDPLLFRAWERSFYWQRYTWSTTSFILLIVEGSKLSEKHFSVTIVSTSTHQPDFGNTIIKVRSLIYITIFLCGLCDTDQIITPDWANMKSVENCGLNRWQSLRYYTALVYTVYFAVSCLKIERKDMSGYC